MMTSPEQLRQQAIATVAAFMAAGRTVATAESCTGGLVAAFLTEVAGSSAVLDRGFVTYSNAAKSEMLGVDPAIIERHGAVSEIVARMMAEGALARSDASATVAITGIAGPGGGTADKPVGLVHFATSGAGVTFHVAKQFGELGRDQIRHASVGVALDMLLSMTER